MPQRRNEQQRVNTQLEKRLPKWYMKTLRDLRKEAFEHKRRLQKQEALGCIAKPQNYQEACGNKEWEDAIKKE